MDFSSRAREVRWELRKRRDVRLTISYPEYLEESIKVTVRVTMRILGFRAAGVLGYRSLVFWV